jgi:hypothetical protein
MSFAVARDNGFAIRLMAIFGSGVYFCEEMENSEQEKGANDLLLLL